MLRDDQKPCDGKSGGVRGIDDTVEDVERSECETVEGTLRTDVRRQDDGDEESEDGVDVH